MTPPTLNITEETHIIDASDSLSISCRYAVLSQGDRGLNAPRPRQEMIEENPGAAPSL